MAKPTLVYVNVHVFNEKILDTRLQDLEYFAKILDSLFMKTFSKRIVEL